MSAIDYGPPERNKSRWYWGKRSGSYDAETKGFCFWQTQYGSGPNNNKGKAKSGARLLAENAISKGWLNGRPLKALKKR